MLFVKQIMKKLNINEIYVDINIMKVKHTCDKPIMVGMGLMGMGTGMVPGTEKCIITHTHQVYPYPWPLLLQVTDNNMFSQHFEVYCCQNS